MKNRRGKIVGDRRWQGVYVPGWRKVCPWIVQNHPEVIELSGYMAQYGMYGFRSEADAALGFAAETNAADLQEIADSLRDMIRDPDLPQREVEAMVGLIEFGNRQTMLIWLGNVLKGLDLALRRGRTADSPTRPPGGWDVDFFTPMKGARTFKWGKPGGRPGNEPGAK